MNALSMFLEGWCDGCDQDPSICLNEGKCVLLNEENNNE